MELPKILAEKNPDEFKSKKVRVQNKRGKIAISSEGSEMDFQEMMTLRKPENPRVIVDEIECNGHLFANLGVSTSLTTSYNGSDYLVLVKQDRIDFGDSVAKLISGYVPADKLACPIESLEEELTEEFLPFSEEGILLGGFLNLKPLPQPFTKIVQYEQRFAYQMFECNLYELSGLVGEHIDIEGKPLQQNGKLYFHSLSNSVQIVFNHHVEIPKITQNGVVHAELNYLQKNNGFLNHSEDVFDPDENSLNVTLKPEGILLLELDGGDITNKIYTCMEGVLKPFNQAITLSEAFAPKDKGIVNQNSITLEDYLRN